MTHSDVVYPNQPLVEVVFEVKFPGELRVECDRHLFWEKIREQYPDVLVPKPNTEKPMALAPYKFKSKDNQMTVMVSMCSLALSTTKYPGYTIFSKEFLRIYKLFGSVFDIKTLSRVGWRYINIIPFIRNENGTIPLAKYLTLGFKVPKSVPEDFKSLDLVFESEHEGASVITQLETIQRKTDHLTIEEALLLDFDYGKVHSGKDELLFKNIPAYLKDAHSKTRNLFEEYITDEYRQYLRGDVI